MVPCLGDVIVVVGAKKQQPVECSHNLWLKSNSGEADFPLNAFFERPKSNAESDELRKYFIQLRHELGSRLVDRVFDAKLSSDGKPSKWWIAFARKKFLKVEL